MTYYMEGEITMNGCPVCNEHLEEHDVAMLDQCATAYFSSNIDILQPSYRVADLVAISRGVGVNIRIETDGVIPFIGLDQLSQQPVSLVTATALILDNLSIVPLPSDGVCKVGIERRFVDKRRAL